VPNFGHTRHENTFHRACPKAKSQFKKL